MNSWGSNSNLDFDEVLTEIRDEIFLFVAEYSFTPLGIQIYSEWSRDNSKLPLVRCLKYLRFTFYSVPIPIFSVLSYLVFPNWKFFLSLNLPLGSYEAKLILVYNDVLIKPS